MMELDEMKHIWKNQQIENGMDYSNQELLMLINNKSIAFEEQIKARDRREIVVAIIVALFFGVFFFFMPSVWQKVGSGIIVLSCILIGYKLRSVRRQSVANEPNHDHSVHQHLLCELRWVKSQKQLLQNVVWWYICPLALGLIVFAFGFQAGIFKVLYIIMVIAMSAATWYLNKRAVNKRFEPLIKHLKKGISAIDGEKK